MSVYPILLDGAGLHALVVGGGAVATRKVQGLVEAGATVRVLAPEHAPELRELTGSAPRLALQVAPYAPGYIADATLVIAATDDPEVNAVVASDARRLGRLVVVASEPALGTCTIPAVHRAGDLVIAVGGGGVPAAAGRIRDALAARFDDRYGRALASLRELRQRLLAAGERDRWTEAAATLIADDFCESVETGRTAAAVEQWD